MSDPEIEDLRDKVHCAVVLERTPPSWRLDRKESTKLSLKYRRGKGEILIVSHGGKGWWNRTSDAKGDVFGLVQRLEPGINFGHVRKRLRELAGLSPSFPIVERAGRRKAPDRTVAERWADRKAVWPSSPTWDYLARRRFLSSAIIGAASKADVLREGPAGSAWFAHVNEAGLVGHVDIRGPTYKGSLTGGAKSLRALDGLPAEMATLPDAVLCSATDANGPGDRFAERHQSLAAKFGVRFERLRPPVEGGDWNDALGARSTGKDQQNVTERAATRWKQSSSLPATATLLTIRDEPAARAGGFTSRRAMRMVHSGVQ
jgi:Protein of unknown function (DUF3991)/Toprim-like